MKLFVKRLIQYNIDPQEVITLHIISDIIVFIIALLTLASCLYLLICLLSKWYRRHTFKNGLFISAVIVVFLITLQKVVVIGLIFNDTSLNYSEYDEPCRLSFLDIQIEILEGILFCLNSTVLFIILSGPVCSSQIILW